MKKIWNVYWTIYGEYAKTNVARVCDSKKTAEAYVKYKYPNHKWNEKVKEYRDAKSDSCGYSEVITIFIEEHSIKGECIPLTQDRLNWIIKKDDDDKKDDCIVCEKYTYIDKDDKNNPYACAKCYSKTKKITHDKHS